jgi:hypothetical protein
MDEASSRAEEQVSRENGLICVSRDEERKKSRENKGTVPYEQAFAESWELSTLGVVS